MNSKIHVIFNISILNPSDLITKFPNGGSSGFIEGILPYLHGTTQVFGLSFNGPAPWSNTIINTKTNFTPIGAMRYPSVFPLRLKALFFYLIYRNKILKRTGGVLYAHAPECVLPFLFFRKSIPLIYQQHGSGNPLIKATYPWARNRFLIGLSDRVLRLIHKKSDWIIAIDSLCHEQACKNRAGHKVSLIRNAIDREMFYPQKRTKDALKEEIQVDAKSKVILFVGRIEEIKRVDKLVDAIGILAGSNQHYLVLIVGEGSLRVTLKSRSMSAGLGEIIRFVGPVRHEQLPAYYNAADVLVLPSEIEGIPMVLLESIACGTPVVASRVGGIPEIVVNGVNGYCIRDTSASNLAQYIQKTVSNKFDRDAVAASVADFSAEKVANDLKTLFQRLPSKEI